MRKLLLVTLTALVGVNAIQLENMSKTYKNRELEGSVAAQV